LAREEYVHDCQGGYGDEDAKEVTGDTAKALSQVRSKIVTKDVSTDVTKDDAEDVTEDVTEDGTHRQALLVNVDDGTYRRRDEGTHIIMEQQQSPTWTLLDGCILAQLDEGGACASARGARAGVVITRVSIYLRFFYYHASSYL